MQLTTTQMRLTAIYLKIAKAEIGTTEIPGPKDNPRIAEYLHATDIGHPYDDNDETPWCSAFVNWVVAAAGVKLPSIAPKGTRSAMARSWLKWGTEIKTPIPGAIVIFRRGKPPQGHVAFVVEKQGSRLLVVGGNQSDAVTQATYPLEDVLGYRIP